MITTMISTLLGVYTIGWRAGGGRGKKRRTHVIMMVVVHAHNDRGNINDCEVFWWSLPFYSVLVSASVCKALSTVFHFINSPSNSPLSRSVLPVLFLPYWPFNYISLYGSLSQPKARTN